MHAVYILLCADNSYYTGQTNHLEKRIWQHETGFFPDCYTYKRRPVKLVWQTRVETAEEANKLEKQIKGWSRSKKEALIRNDINELKRLSNQKKEKPDKSLRQAQGHMDYLLVGQGISGTWLSYYLQKEKKSFLVIDEARQNSPSRMAAGIINPVTGRRHVTAWKADEVIPFSLDAYQTIGRELDMKTITPKSIIYFFPTVQMRESFLQRMNEKSDYLAHGDDKGEWRKYFQYDFDFGEIQPAYTVHLETLLPAWRNELKKNNLLREEIFDVEKLGIHADKVVYDDISAGKIIFCDGLSSFSYPFFKKLPFAPNKGEALVLEIKDLPGDHIYKKGYMLAPLEMKQDHWWLGSNYAWDFEHEMPTELFRKQAEASLQSWLRIPYKVVDHIAAIRPATLERRPFVGIHPLYNTVAILNGMGTKGCSLAPYFAKQLVEHLLHHKPIDPEADIGRFGKVLSRPV
jgi:predicted GIY-YIG superfamily endonuclease/glycine/D-amino acid oxidase-like deaminating enzyme